MNILEQSKNEEFVKEQFIKGRILDDTKDYGRTQFVDEIYKLQQENQKLKDELKNKPDTQITLQDDKGNKFILIQTERIDIQVELNKTIEKLFNNWNKLKEWLKKELGDRINPNKDKWLTGVYDAYRETIDKMQELQGSDESGKNQC